MRPTQSETLTDTNNDTTSNEAADITLWRKGLHKGCDDDSDSTRGHTNAATESIGNGSSHEPTRNDSTDGIGSVYCTDQLGVLRELAMSFR